MNGAEICQRICNGCSACMSICPKSAIEMKEDKKGFRYPVVNEKKCINCGLCKKTCNSKIYKNAIKETYILKNKDSVQHIISQSGGAFSAISDSIIENGGKVFGVIYDENYEAVFGSAKSKSEREAMHGSKYMQARVEYAYREVEQALSEGSVLFSGTPCQVGALKKYLQTQNVDIKNLYTVGIICHGVPSVLLWRKFLEDAEKKVGKIKQVSCRDKLLTGWMPGANHSSFFGTNKYSTDKYLKIFWTSLCLRDSCYKCEYTELNRCEDITIADAWGVKKNNPDFADSRGVSLLLINSSKGEKLFDSLKNRVEWQEVELDRYMQKNMQEPSKSHRSVTEFWKDFDTKDLNYIIKKYGENNPILNYKYIIRRGISALCKKK